MRTETRTSLVRRVNDVYHIQRMLLRLETGIRARSGEQDLGQMQPARIYYIAYARRAGGLFSAALSAIYKTKELKDVVASNEKEILGNLEGLAIKLANCCEEFSRVCFSIARAEYESLGTARFSWNDRIWARYKKSAEIYQVKAQDFPALWKAEMPLQRGFVALPTLVMIALQIVILVGLAYVGYHTFYPQHSANLPASVATTTPATLPKATSTESTKPSTQQKTTAPDPICIAFQAQLTAAQRNEQNASVKLWEAKSNPPASTCGNQNDQDMECQRQYLNDLKALIDGLEAVQASTSAQVEKIQTEFSARCKH